MDIPTRVRAHVLSGNLVRVKWNARERDVRFFQLQDYYRKIGHHVPSTQRQAEVHASYGTHCYRVESIAMHGAKDSGPSVCAMIAVTAGPVPPIVGTWKRVAQQDLDDPPVSVDGPYLIVYADGTYRGGDVFDNVGSTESGWWWVSAGGYQLTSSPRHQDERGTLEGDDLTLSCCSVRYIYQRI